MRKQPNSINFVKTGARTQKVTSPDPMGGLISPAGEWEVLADFEHSPLVFPTFITVTAQRPDIVIWSRKLKIVILIELTCPAEENVVDAQNRKMVRYENLVAECQRTKIWTAHLFTVEIGARGFVVHSFA